MDNKYYVYFHMKDGEIVYVGKGTDARAWSNKRTNQEHTDWITNCQHDGINFVHIAESRLDSNTAYQREAYYIDEYGPRYNQTHTKCELCGDTVKNMSAHMRFNHIGA